MSGRTTDGLILMSNGDVENFNLETIQQAINEIPQQGFYENHCQVVGCDDCKLGACPIADQ